MEQRALWKRLGGRQALRLLARSLRRGPHGLLRSILRCGTRAYKTKSSVFLSVLCGHFWIQRPGFGKKQRGLRFLSHLCRYEYMLPWSKLTFGGDEIANTNILIDMAMLCIISLLAGYRLALEPPKQAQSCRHFA